MQSFRIYAGVDLFSALCRRVADGRLRYGMQPDVSGWEVTTFPFTTSARTEDAPQVHGGDSRFAPVAVAAVSVSTATSATNRQAMARSRWPQSLTRQGWR